MDIKNFIEQSYTLWTQDYWRDEIFTIFLSQKSYLEIILLTAKDFNPPLYYLVTKLLIVTFGTSSFYLRQIPLIFHILSAVMAFKLARLFTTRLSAILYSLAVLTNIFLFYYAFELRPYSAMVFLSILSIYFYFSKNKIGFVISNILGLYMHTYYLIFYLMFFLYKCLSILKKYRSQILFQNVSQLATDVFALVAKPYLILPVLFYLPWVPILIQQTISKSNGFWLEKVSVIEIFTATFTYLAGLNYIPISFTLVILICFALIIGFGYKKINANILKISLVFGLTPVVLVVLISTFSPIFTTRYLIFTVPFLLLFFVGLIDSQIKTLKLFLITIFILIIAGYTCLDYYAFNHPTNYRYGYLAYETINNSEKKLEIVITTDPIKYFGVIYYFEREGVKRENIKYFNLNKTFPHFMGDVVIKESDIINIYPQNQNYLYLGKQSF